MLSFLFSVTYLLACWWLGCRVILVFALQTIRILCFSFQNHVSSFFSFSVLFFPPFCVTFGKEKIIWLLSYLNISLCSRIQLFILFSFCSYTVLPLETLHTCSFWSIRLCLVAFIHSAGRLCRQCAGDRAGHWIHQDKPSLVFVPMKLTSLGASLNSSLIRLLHPPVLPICVFFARTYVSFLLADTPVLIFKRFQNIICCKYLSYAIEVA